MFTLGLTFTYNFTQVKVKKLGMPHRVNCTSSKILSPSLKNAIVKIKDAAKKRVVFFVRKLDKQCS